MNQQDPKPADFMLDAALSTGASASQVRKALNTALSGFDAQVKAQESATALVRAATPTPPDTVHQMSGAEQPMQPMPLDPGYQQPIEQGSGQGVGVVCTGILNGAAASVTVMTAGDLAPL